jgi:hypothetical protein
VTVLTYATRSGPAGARGYAFSTSMGTA